MRRIISIDPGAERLGWAVLTSPYDSFKPEVIASGILGLARGDNEKYQDYKLRLIEYWSIKEGILYEHQVTTLVNETQPAVGGGNYVAATQSELAKTALTVLQAGAYRRGLKVVQIGATTIKKQIGGNQKATKVKVRNGVIELVPSLAERKKDWVKIFDEPDAIAVGLTYLQNVV